jgi:protein kinase C substrate 80K-H
VKSAIYTPIMYALFSSLRNRAPSQTADADGAITMHFTDGQTCWNGPARSLSVRLQCGAAPADGNVAQLLSVEEPGKCVYAAVVATPVACSREQLERARQRLEAQMAEATRPKGHHLKDEL